MKKSFEWYYFDLHSADGYDLVFTLHTLPFMTQFAVSIFDLFIYKDNHLLEHRFFTRPLHDLQRDKNSYEIYFDDKNFILYDKRTIRLSAAAPRISLELNFVNVLGDKAAFEHDLLDEENKAGSFVWKLHAPICEAHAEIHIENKQFRFKGQGYHDYNAGNIFLKRKLSGWRWSKFYYRDNLVIVGEIMPRTGKTKSILVLASKSALQWTDDIMISRNGDRFTLQSQVIRFVFEQEKYSRLDDIRFLSLKPPKILRIPAKIVEIMSALSLHFAFLKPLRKILTNARYVRRRLSGQIDNEKQTNVFQEEIFF